VIVVDEVAGAKIPREGGENADPRLVILDP
jgi:hypothetical protein